MLALATWEASPNGETAARVKTDFDAVLDAWRRAGSEYDLQINSHAGPPQRLGEED